MGVTLGVGLIVGVPFSVMDAYQVIPFHVNIAYLVILMSLTFGVSNLYGTWRYRCGTGSNKRLDYEPTNTTGEWLSVADPHEH
jgi:hypothetical protein